MELKTDVILQLGDFWKDILNTAAHILGSVLAATVEVVAVPVVVEV